MRLKNITMLFVLVLCFAITGPNALADSVTITNPSFETPGAPVNSGCGTGCAYNGVAPLGWTGGGSFEPGGILSPVPDGSLIAYANAGGSISQTLSGTSLVDNSVYTLSLFVGNRGGSLGGNYTLSLDTILGGITTTLCTFSGNAASPNIAVGTFQVEGCTYASGSTPPAGNLFLQFTALNGQLDVDNVSLTVQPNGPVGVPEPSSMLLLGIGALLVLITWMLRENKALQLRA
jgi:PEP-CTERM motif